MVRVLTACGIKWSHNCRGNSLSVVARALMKCALKVCMAHLAALAWLLFGSTKRFSHFFEDKELLDDATHLHVHNI